MREKKLLNRKLLPFRQTVKEEALGVSQSGSVDKRKKNGFLYGILIIPIAGGHFL